MSKSRKQKLEVRILKRSEYALWDEVVENSLQNCIFLTSSWLKNYSEDAYEIAGVFRDGHLIGGLVLQTRPNSLVRTKILGPVLPVPQKDQNRSLPKRYEEEKAFLGVLADYINENVANYRQRWHPSIENWMPFMWARFEERTQYYYVLDVTGGAENIWNRFQTKIRGDVRKAEQVGIKCIEDDGSQLLALDRTQFMGLEDENFLRKAISELQPAGKLRIFLSTKENKILSGIIVLYDSETAYYWNAFRLKEDSLGGAQSFLLWSALKSLPEGLKQFNFLGSIDQDIEKFFRGFGGELVSYFRVGKKV